ncbi:MAG: hypothetical protein JSS20_02645 [Proteobacteria bacterium]|nr:hypothetical protein [Pseudomonadota bacterium]
MLFVAALLLPLAAAFVILAVERWRMPAFLALMTAALLYGLLAGRHLQSFATAFGLGFANAIEQTGVLVVLGAWLSRVVGLRNLRTAWAAGAGALAGITASPAGALAMLAPAAQGSVRRTLVMLLALLAAEALIVCSPVATSAATVVHANLIRLAELGIPIAAGAVMAGMRILGRKLPPDSATEPTSRHWLLPLALLGLMLILALAQVPSEPLGKRASTLLYTNLGRPFVVATLGLVAVWLLARRVSVPDLGERDWASLLLAVGASGGLSFVLNETGAPELLAEKFLHPSLGLLVPFLAAVVMKTMQGNSLTAVLTAIGMTEPMLPDLGLASEWGRVLAAGAAGAGSVALCHVNDPLFWIGAHMSGLSPRGALRIVTLGSAAVGVAILVGLLLLRLVL